MQIFLHERPLFGLPEGGVYCYPVCVKRTALILLTSLSWLILCGGFPTGLVEELVHDHTAVQEQNLVERHGRMTATATPASLVRFATPSSDRRPDLEPGCKRSRIRTLPIARRGPPA